MKRTILTLVMAVSIMATFSIETQAAQNETEQTEQQVVSTEQKETAEDLEIKTSKVVVKQGINELNQITKKGFKKLKKATRKSNATKKYVASLVSQNATEAKEKSKKANTLLKETKSLLKQVEKCCNLSLKKYDETHELLKPLEILDQDFYEETKAELIIANRNRKNLKRSYNKAQKKHATYVSQRKSFENLVKSLKKKLRAVDTSSWADMRRVIGFTTEELQFLLTNSNVVNNPYILTALAKEVPKCAKKYKVNEIGAIAIMAVETGRFTSSLCLNHNNFGGLLGDVGWMHFSSVQRGIEKMIECVHQNMGRGSTLPLINSTYCPGDIQWTYDVMSLEKELISVKF